MVKYIPLPKYIPENHYVWIEPAQKMLKVPVDLYLKLVDMKIWSKPDTEIRLNKKNRPLKLYEIDPFPSGDKYISYP